MINEIEICLSPEFAFDDFQIENAVKTKLGKSYLGKSFVVKSRSLDARSRVIVYRLKVLIYDSSSIPELLPQFPALKNVADGKRIIIVGAGPAGLFAALECIRLGLKPIIIERGKTVKVRRRDLAKINKEGVVNPESNYCFGEGGAGTYSDGKLYTRSTKRGDVNEILSWLIHHGAKPDIAIEAHPHIGTNKLPQIIEEIRNTILHFGGEIHFDTKLTFIGHSFSEFKYVLVNDSVKIEGAACILATGHSANDIYTLLDEQKIKIEAKPFAIGVRIEHSQELINQIQYRNNDAMHLLPPASYSLVCQADGKGVYSFCMCPGGIIAPCSTNDNEIVTNGWSPSKRNNPYANSGLVVELDLAEIGALDNTKSLSGLHYRSTIEQKSFQLGGGNLVAPAQRVMDFISGKVSVDLPKNSYHPGTNSVDLREVFPNYISSRLKKGLIEFGKKRPGYLTNDGILVATESRTSSPIRIPRDKESFMHPEIKGFFPCGEGAGYAGGIVSAAIDGRNCAMAAFRFLE